MDASKLVEPARAKEPQLELLEATGVRYDRQFVGRIRKARCDLTHSLRLAETASARQTRWQAKRLAAKIARELAKDLARVDELLSNREAESSRARRRKVNRRPLPASAKSYRYLRAYAAQRRRQERTRQHRKIACDVRHRAAVAVTRTRGRSESRGCTGRRSKAASRSSASSDGPGEPPEQCANAGRRRLASTGRLR